VRNVRYLVMSRAREQTILRTKLKMVVQVLHSHLDSKNMNIKWEMSSLRNVCLLHTYANPVANT
jgi:hypothetical protein